MALRETRFAAAPDCLTVFWTSGSLTVVGNDPTIEQFVYSCIQNRTAALKIIVESRQAYRRRFYESECIWDSRGGVVELSAAEKIMGVSPSKNGFEVITTGSHPNHRSRYRVKTHGESWLIQGVDTECGHCRLFGFSNDCSRCGGTEWHRWKGQPKSEEQRAVRQASPDLEKESEGSLLHNPAIEQLMTVHFRERTATLKREREIYGEYAKRFFAPEYDWTQWVVSAEDSDAEKIAAIMPTDTGAFVITSGFGPMLLRYHLRRQGQKWLIRKVDNECPVCNKHGKSADCFWCKGTIWEGGLAHDKPPEQTEPL